MRVIAELPYCIHGRPCCGDADHDGRPEFYAVGAGGGHALEHIGGNQFDATLVIPGWTLLSDIGDADRDGKTDLLIQQPATRLRIFESPDSWSLPTNEVWVDLIEYMSCFAHAVFADLDQDSATEILVSDRPGSRVRIYENVADDSYELKTSIWHVAKGFCELNDLDRDGRRELAICHDASGELSLIHI